MGEKLSFDTEIDQEVKRIKEKDQFEKGRRERKEYGKDIFTTIEFTRHEEPGKTPEGMSADFLTSEGQTKAKAKGKEIKEPKVAGFASPKLRAQETVDLALKNVGEDVEVINRTIESLKGTRAEDKPDLPRSDKQRPENIFRIKTKPELDTIVGFAKLNDEAKTWAKEQINAGSKRTPYDLVVQYYLDHPDRCKELGVTTPREAAAEIAFRARRELGMPERFYEGSRVRLINITHGPKLEPFLKEVLINQDGSRGFKSLDEIGGSLNPGENFQFRVEINEQGEKKIKLLFREKEYEVDEEAIKLLAKEYINKLEEAEKEKKE